MQDDPSPADNQVPAKGLERRLVWASSGVWVCALMLITYALYIGRNLFVPIAVAGFAYLTVRPAIRVCTHLRIPPAVSATAIMTAICILLGGGCYMLLTPAKEMLADVPHSLAEAKSKLDFVFKHIETVNQATEDISQAAEDEKLAVDPKPVEVEIKQPVWTKTSPFIAGTGNFVSFLMISGVLLYFLMASGDALIVNLMNALPNFSAKKRFINVINSVQDGLSMYLAWVTLINAALGLAIGLSMWLLGMPSPLLWGVAAMLLNYIPLLGALCGIAMVFFVGLVHFDHASFAFVVAGVYATLTTLEGQIITPALLGRSLRMCSVLVFLSAVVWGWLWGIMGVFLAVPILIAVMMIAEKLEVLAPLAHVLGTPATERPAVA